MNPAATGFEIYSLTPRGAPSTYDDHLAPAFINMQAGSPVDGPSLALSASVYHAMLGHLPEFDRGIKRARFAVLRLTQIPAILVEGGFVTEQQQSRLIAHKEWRGKLAKAISVGIENYKALVEKKQRPMLLADYRRQLDGVLVARDATRPSLDVMAGSSIFPARNQGSAPGNIQITANAARRPADDIVPNEPTSAPAAGPSGLCRCAGEGHSPITSPVSQESRSKQYGERTCTNPKSLPEDVRMTTIAQRKQRPAHVCFSPGAWSAPSCLFLAFFPFFVASANAQVLIKEVVSREASLFVENGLVDQQVVSREVSLALGDAAPPPQVTG
jgi:N-acetylmuramoyl-L-alanine amidase